MLCFNGAIWNGELTYVTSRKIYCCINYQKNGRPYTSVTKISNAISTYLSYVSSEKAVKSLISANFIKPDITNVNSIFYTEVVIYMKLSLMILLLLTKFQFEQQAYSFQHVELYINNREINFAFIKRIKGCRGSGVNKI